ncbi:MAG: DUF58 domain-containing protein [Candidatus Thiodiazotropha sp.]
MKIQSGSSSIFSPQTLDSLQRWINLHRVLWVLTLACFFVAWNRGLALLYGVFSLSLALLLISQVMPRWQLRGIQVERRFPPIMSAGEEIEVVYRLSGSGHRYHTRIIDDIPFADGPASGFLPVWETSHEITSRVCCEHRGLFTLDPLRLTSAYPFGILSHERCLSSPGEPVRVLPRLYELGELPTPQHANQNSEGDLPIAQRDGQEQFLSIREYVHGDSLRHIHWRASARLQRLVVKEYERDDRPMLLLALDCRAAFNKGEGNRTTFEFAISLAASVIRQATREGMSSVLIAEHGKRLETAIPAYQSDLYEVLAQLAELQDSGNLSSRELIEEAIHRYPQANLVVGFRLRDDPLIPAFPPHVTHIDFEMDDESFHFPLRHTKAPRMNRFGNRLSYPVSSGHSMEGLLQ